MCGTPPEYSGRLGGAPLPSGLFGGNSRGLEVRGLVYFVTLAKTNSLSELRFLSRSMLETELKLLVELLKKDWVSIPFQTN